VKLNELLNIQASAGFGMSVAARNIGNNHSATKVQKDRSIYENSQALDLFDCYLTHIGN